MDGSENLSYDAQRDRLIGGDAFADFHGRPVKKVLASMSIAMTLKNELLSFDTAYKRRTGDSGVLPYPRILAVLSPGFELGSHSGLPEDYSELAEIISIVPGITNLNRALPSTHQACKQFATQLLRLLQIAHFDADLVFNRGGGTSLDVEYVTAKGEFTDLYFLTSTSDLSLADRRQRQALDLVSAIGLLWRVTGPIPTGAASLFELGVSSYLDTPNLPPDVRTQITAAIETLALGSLPAAQVALQKLAAGIQQKMKRDNVD
jgi:hypothetical protein